MPLSAEKTRLVQECDRYLAGRHDADKVRIARAAKLGIPLVGSYGELTAMVTAFKDELEILVGAKNQRRWFGHKPGDLHGYFSAALTRIAAATRTETDLFRIGPAKPEVTVRDWNRHAGGKAYVVNGVGFQEEEVTIPAIRSFLTRVGVRSTRIRDYLCDYANQDGLFAAGHVAFAAAMTVGVPLQFAGMRHEYTSTTADAMKAQDEAIFTVMGHGGEDDVVRFTQRYLLVDDGRQIVTRQASYAFEGAEWLDVRTRGLLASALDDFVIPH